MEDNMKLLALKILTGMEMGLVLVNDKVVSAVQQRNLDMTGMEWNFVAGSRVALYDMHRNDEGAKSWRGPITFKNKYGADLCW